MEILMRVHQIVLLVLSFKNVLFKAFRFEIVKDRLISIIIIFHESLIIDVNFYKSFVKARSLLR